MRRNIPPEQARTEYIEELKRRGFGCDTEEVPVLETCGRITAEAVYARCSAPAWSAAAMDGIAFSSLLTASASEDAPVRLLPGQYRGIGTGDPIPEDCDTVLMNEELVREADDSVLLRRPVPPWHCIRQIGEDICAGEMILSSYVKISPAALGAMTAGGVERVQVFRRPVAGILPAGGESPDAGAPVYSAMLRDWGADTVLFPPVTGGAEELRAALQRAAEQCDLVIFSAGRENGIEEALTEEEIFCYGVAMKPGKPAILGLLGIKPVIGVPKYPVSGILILEELLKPLLKPVPEDEAKPGETAEAVLTKSLHGGDRQEYVRVRVGCVEGKWTATPVNRGSGVVSSFLKADGILTLAPNSEPIRAGQTVSIRLLKSSKKIENTLTVTGSHDPLLDELADLMHAADHSVFMSSSHVGSMGGIQAIRRGEAHAAGCHLLDTKDGSYNLAFLRKYFPKGEVRLVRCVGRVQGLLVASGNPLDLRDFRDICRPGLRYVNRQNGSGTRILTDYLCGKYGIDPGTISGYAREEMTHSAVAAQIACGSADAGMGIHSAAKLAGLDFVPVCEEEYDLIVPSAVWNSPMVQLMLETLKSETFRQRVLALGGYTVDRPGEIIEYLT